MAILCVEYSLNIESGAARGSLFTRIDSCPFFSLQGICVDAFCQIIETFNNGICKLMMSSDNNLTVISLDDLSLHLYDIFNRRMVRRFDKSHGNRITNSGVSPVRLWLVSSSLDCTIKCQHKVHGHCPVQTTRHLPGLSKTYYCPSIALRQLPGAPFIDEKVSTEGGDEVVEQHPRQQEVTEEDGLSASRWAKLSDLDLHRQRNKPKQQLLKAGKAPFFLISTPGLVPSFDVEEEQVAQLSRLLKSPIVMS
ncbi:WD repeat-containing protein 36, partial [Trichinella nelsoni]